MNVHLLGNLASTSVLQCETCDHRKEGINTQTIPSKPARVYCITFHLQNQNNRYEFCLNLQNKKSHRVRNMKRFSILCQTMALVLLFQSSAYAHSTETINNSLLSGLLHPLLGLDHLLAMIAIGLWSNQQKTFHKPMMLVIIAGSLFAGFIISHLVPFYPLLEPTLAASILVISLFSLFAAKLNPQLSLLIIVFFVLHHGFAHGSEMQAGISGLYLIGFIACSLILQILGQLLPLTLKPYLEKLPGIMLALAGSVLTIFSLS